MKPRVGFLGTGWIGRHRMAAMLGCGAVEAAAICDPADECAEEAAKLAPAALRYGSLDEMLALGLDGVVIATPSALHAEQAISALTQGAAVFCQKPLGRTYAETAEVVAAARRADRLLGCDLSYRYTDAARKIAGVIRSGGIGRVFAADLSVHNAYGPDKAWFYDPAQSGGGCMIDLGVHLVDLALIMLDFPEIGDVEAHFFTQGAPRAEGGIEDYGVAQFLAGGALIRVACSWRLHAGQDAVIEAAFHGTEGGVALRNTGSFYDFVAERFIGTRKTRLSAPPDDWGGRAAVAWAERLAASGRYDCTAEEFLQSAKVIDRIYALDQSAALQEAAAAA